MKNKTTIRFFALVLSLLLIVSGIPAFAFADAATELSMTEGDVKIGFAPEGTECVSSDPSIAWVDESGSLNALKPGTATVTVPADGGQSEYSVTVRDYDDGSGIVGNLKILARYNDSMQFYDGHVYLLFTSYQDGVTITVPDLYGGYEIADCYYGDIREDIANGSNHTGTDSGKYFTFSNEMKSVTLDRGEIVTIGMYRGFDLTVPQAALGSIKNSSLWSGLVNTGKSVVIESIFGLLDSGKISADDAADRIKAVFDEAGLDYNKLIDGVVEGGVCFNRELYNQKLEWDQYENVTYELDITREQLNLMQMYLVGNLNKFSILKNSCATVALRAWNAAVGTRNGEDTAYKLSSAGEGIFAVIDAPKGVRDNIVSRLPGYYFNNSEGVEEPDAGYQDETGWVYVSAPEPVAPVTLIHESPAIFIDESKTKSADLINAAKGGSVINYAKEDQDIDVSINSADRGDAAAVESIVFSVNGSVFTLNGDNMPAKGVWFKVWIDDPAEGEDYYATDADGNVLANEYNEGWLSFLAPSLPLTYKIVSSAEGAQNILRTVVVNGDKADAQTEVYVKNGDEKTVLGNPAEVGSGTKVYISASVSADDFDYILSDITLNGESLFSDENYDADEGAYFAVMPSRYSIITVTYEEAYFISASEIHFQVAVGDVFDASKLIKLYVGDNGTASDDIVSSVRSFSDTDQLFIKNGNILEAVSEGYCMIDVCAKGNENIGMLYIVDICASDDPGIVYDSTTEKNIQINSESDGHETEIPFSGYRVKKGSVLTFEPRIADSGAVMYLIVNDKLIPAGGSFTVDGDVKISSGVAPAQIKGVPEKIELASQGDTYQLEAKVSYKGLYGLLPVYDPSIEYISSDPLVTVDENGLITVEGEVPENGAKVFVTAYAGSSGRTVYASAEIIVGNYKASKPVGNITVSARCIHKGELVAHGALTFTTYEDVDMDVSYYHYYKPNDKYNDLMIDYEQNPGNYSSDPALCNDNELGLTDRESYFDTLYNGANSDPQTVSLKAGESISISNYSFDSTNLVTLRKALEGTIYGSEDAQELVRQMMLYENGEQIDGVSAFDSFVSTLMQMYAFAGILGTNPADGQSVGGMDINREMFNQFRRNDSQMPNNYYTVEITADELAMLKNYIANPQNNYYSLFVKNCAAGVIDIWNTTLSDRPELALSGNLTGLASDPESLYFELGAMRLRKGLDGEGGTDFYPRTVRYSDATKAVIDAITDLAESDGSKEWLTEVEAVRGAYDALTESEKLRVWNYGKLTGALEQYEALKGADDRAEFEEYKLVCRDAADALAAEGDSKTCEALIAVAKLAIDAVRYDEGKTLDENKAALDSIISSLSQALERQRKCENPIIGDADGDGEVTIADATLIQRISVVIKVTVKVNNSAADVDGDGTVTVIDAAYIQRWVVGASAKEGIGQPAENISDNT